ncbi:MAG: ATP-dependent Clp protease ATP-binding subunit [Candidatus Niyogibacteria bacterium]|nr:ATP-dependent Clp protease ATP-binding subunit [Candidatus Niyogibacteria bacterium]
MKKIVLDPAPCALERDIFKHLSGFVVGQERPKRRVASMILRYKGLRDPRRPAGTMFCLGPTGVGKTETVKAMAHRLFGDLNGYTHISCGNYQNGHEVTQLLGAPPSYIGFNDTPKLSQKLIDAPDVRRRVQRERDLEESFSILESEKKTAGAIRRREIDQKLEKMRDELTVIKDSPLTSIILWDEIEKAHPDLIKITLDLLSEGRVHLNNNQVTNCADTFVFFTSNTASQDIGDLLGGKKIQMGFHAESEALDLEMAIYKKAMAKLEKIISPEFLGRIGKENVVTYVPLNDTQRAEVFDLRVADIRSYIAASGKQFSFEVSAEAKWYLIAETRDPKNIALGMRAVTNVVQKKLLDPLNSIIVKERDEGGIAVGDSILAELGSDGELRFVRLEADKALIAGR